MTDKRLESLDLNLLLALHWILGERNITAAAGKIGVSQPAASRALARLREVFDDPLLVRSGNEMVPTRMGEKLQPVVAHAVERCRDVLRISDKFEPTEQTGQFRIACVDYLGIPLISAWEAVIRPVAPGLELDIINLNFAASKDLVSGKIDLVLMPDPSKLNLPAALDIEQFVRRKIFQNDYVTVLRKGHPLLKGKLTLKKFVELEHILVAPEGGRLGIVDELLLQKNMTRKVVYRTHSFLLALPVILMGDYVATVPGTLAEIESESLEILKPPLEVPGMDMFVGWHPNWTHDERHRWVRGKLLEEVERITS